MISKTSGLVGGVGFSKLPLYSFFFFYYINKTEENMRHLRLALWFSIKAALFGSITDCSWLQLWMLVPKDVHRLEASACWVRAFSLWELHRAAVLGAGPVRVLDWNHSGFHGRRSESQQLAWKRKRTFYCERVCAEQQLQSFRLTRGTHSYFCVFIYCRCLLWRTEKMTEN